jgi:glycopeptide antibiotics resistance protein
LRRINLIPLYFGRFATPRSIFYAMFLNIVLTIPFGFTVRLIMRFKEWDFLWLGPFAGLAIESAQLLVILLTSNPYRVIDVNDVIANATGVWVGFIAFRIFAWIYQAITRWLRIHPRGVFGYLHEVTRAS